MCSISKVVHVYDYFQPPGYDNNRQHPDLVLLRLESPIQLDWFQDTIATPFLDEDSAVDRCFVTGKHATYYLQDLAAMSKSSLYTSY